MIELLTVMGILFYVMLVGVSIAILMWKYPPDYEPVGQVMGGIFWPLVLPVVFALILTERVLAQIDERQARTAQEAKELRRQVKDLEEELRGWKV